MNVLNQYSESVEIQFDAAYNPDSPYVWQPGEVKSLSEQAALFCRRKSVVKENPVTGVQTRALLVQGVDPEYDAVAGAGEFLPCRGPELLDRSNMDPQDQKVQYQTLANPVMMAAERGSAAPQTHARRPQA